MNILRQQESVKVNQIVASYLRAYQTQFPDFIRLDEQMWDLFEQKSASPGIRSYIAYKLFTLSGGQEWERNIGPLLGMIEMSIISSYATNRVFDKKSGGRSESEAIKSVIASALAREGVFQTLQNCYEQEIINRLCLWYEISEIQRWFYLGQYINSFKNVLPQSIQEQIRVDSTSPGYSFVLKQVEKVEELLCAKIPELSNKELNIFITNQFLRLYLINSHFYEKFAALSVKFHRDISAEQEALLNGFGALFGVGTQIINDIIDFALPSMGLNCTAKFSADFYSDVRNGVATFPIFLGLYQGGQAKGKVCLSETYFSVAAELADNKKEDILYYLIESKAIQTSLQIAAICLSEAKYYLTKAQVVEPDSELLNIFEIYRESRFVVNMFKWYRIQRRKKRGE